MPDFPEYADQNRWKIWADVYFRFNPKKFRSKDKGVSTSTELEEANTIGSMSEKEFNGGPARILNCLDKDARLTLFFRVFNSVCH